MLLTSRQWAVALTNFLIIPTLEGVHLQPGPLVHPEEEEAKDLMMEGLRTAIGKLGQAIVRMGVPAA